VAGDRGKAHGNSMPSICFWSLCALCNSHERKRGKKERGGGKGKGKTLTIVDLDYALLNRRGKGEGGKREDGRRLKEQNR